MARTCGSTTCPLDGRDLTILVTGYENESNFEAIAKAAQTILDSLVILTP